MAPRVDRAVRWAVGFIALLTAYRLVLQWFNATDLFVDEAQYWAWGQHLDWGYFSKPPMIGWLIRAVTDLAGSDAGFWVRAPGAVLHGITALLILAAGRQFYDGWVGAWAAAIYLAMPLVTVGSALMSTDTVMLPFFALALWMYARLMARPSLPDAAIMGAAIGAGMMSKYAMVYLPLCMGLVALIQPTGRLRVGDYLTATAIALALFAPNIWWNITHDATTVRHVIEDNANWSGLNLRFDQAVNFLASQALAFGPILIVALFAAPLRHRLRGPDLTLFLLSVPIILIVVGQSLMSRAYANWAATAYVAAPILVVAVLQYRPRLLWLSQGINGVIAVLVPLLFATPLLIYDAKERPLMDRYLGLHSVSQQAGEIARNAGLTTLVAENRALLADLTYTLDETNLQIRAENSDGHIDHYYDQTFAHDGSVPFAYLGKTPPCAGQPIGQITATIGRWRTQNLQVWRIDRPC